jgi:hypothetical protein
LKLACLFLASQAHLLIPFPLSSLPSPSCKQLIAEAMLGPGVILETNVATACDNSSALPDPPPPRPSPRPPSPSPPPPRPSPPPNPPASGRRSLLATNVGACDNPAARIQAQVVLRILTASDVNSTISRLYALLSGTNSGGPDLAACIPNSTNGSGWISAQTSMVVSSNTPAPDGVTSTENNCAVLDLNILLGLNVGVAFALL